MSVFDAHVFAVEILKGPRQITGQHVEITSELLELEKDIEATLAALEFEGDSRRARALKEDLEKFLPARKASLLAQARAGSSIYLVAALETALESVLTGTIATATAFLRSY